MTIAVQQAVYFLALARRRSFTRAAAECGVRQPSLSLAIKEMETSLGGHLFERANTGVRLTALGRVVKPHLAALVRAAARAQDAAQKHISAQRHRSSGQPASPLPCE